MIFNVSHRIFVSTGLFSFSLATFKRFLYICCGAVVTFILIVSKHPKPGFHLTINQDIHQHLVLSRQDFPAQKIREFPCDSKNENDWKNFDEVKEGILSNFDEVKEGILSIHDFQEKLCDKWVVIATISNVSEAVRRFFYKPDWCVVVVGDLGRPKVNLICSGDNLKVNFVL